MVCMAPLPRSSGGLLAVRALTGTPDCAASTIAGWRLATAVPEVTTTGTAEPEPAARPSARYPAPRSSMRTWSRIRPARSAAASASASGALRDPGHRTASRTPWRTNSSTRTRACAVLGLLALGVLGLGLIRSILVAGPRRPGRARQPAGQFSDSPSQLRRRGHLERCREAGQIPGQHVEVVGPGLQSRQR